MIEEWILQMNVDAAAPVPTSTVTKSPMSPPAEKKKKKLTKKKKRTTQQQQIIIKRIHKESV